ncbi:MAG: uroporphyrinogen-III C-methyltransferase [Breznakibacter sp.]
MVIAGFGPGDPGLVTRRTEAFLAWADYIIYDDLIDTSILGRYCAHKIYVGKRKGAHYSPQDEINQLMHRHAVGGKRVVRLKGGDPLVFGRGAEEFHFLSERLVKATIIPGISSALAAAAAAVVPLTARGVSSSVVFLSGHDLVKLQVPKADTLVVFMGASTQSGLAKKLMDEGWNPKTPVVVVKDASKQTEEKRRYTLATLSEDGDPLGSPSIIIVGNSAGIRGGGMPQRWLFTGLNPADFKEDGICVHSPMIAIRPLPLDERMVQALRGIAGFDRIVFTSRYAVQHFFDRLMEVGLDARALSPVKITSIGRTTSKALRDKGILAPPEPAEDSSQGLVEWFKQQTIAGEHILIPRSSLGLPVLPDGLTALGHQVTVLPVYDTVMPDNIIRHNLDDFDGVVFTSPSTIDNFIRFYGQLPPHLKVAARGRETGKRVSGHLTGQVAWRSQVNDLPLSSGKKVQEYKRKTMDQNPEQ